MGQEAACTCRAGLQVSKGKALLESTEILFRGEFRLAIPFQDIRAVAAKNGVLAVKTAAGTTSFELGPRAEKWAEKIRSPRSLIDKLGVEPGHTVSVIGVADAGFLRDARARAAGLSTGRPRKDSNLVFLGVASVAALERLSTLRESIRRDGGIWVIWPKGQPHIKEDHVRAAAKRAGLTDVKVVAFSTTHSALKLVIPLAKR